MRQAIARRALSSLQTLFAAMRHSEFISKVGIGSLNCLYWVGACCNRFRMSCLHTKGLPGISLLAPIIANDSAKNMPPHQKSKKYLRFSLRRPQVRLGALAGGTMAFRKRGPNPLAKSRKIPTKLSIKDPQLVLAADFQGQPIARRKLTQSNRGLLRWLLSSQHEGPSLLPETLRVKILYPCTNDVGPQPGPSRNPRLILRGRRHPTQWFR